MTSQKLARKIMDENFLGVEEVAEHFGIVLRQEEHIKVAVVPFSEETLQKCQKTHILFLGLPHDNQGEPLTINRFSEFPMGGLLRFWSFDNRYHGSEDQLELRWYLFRKAILDESRSKTYAQQERLLKETEYRECTIVYIYGILLMFLARDERLFENSFILCRDGYSGGRYTCIGSFESGGLLVQDMWEGACNPRVGLAPARKFDYTSKDEALRGE